MKAALILFGMAIGSFCYAQKSLESVISPEICDCLTNSDLDVGDQFMNCFWETLEKHKELMVEECLRVKKDTSEEAGYAFGQDLFYTMSVNLVYSCTPYYLFMDSLRYDFLKTLDMDSVRNEINTITRSNLAARNADFFTNRGVMYFQTGEIDLAIQDFESAIRLNENAFQAIYFKGWTLELKKDYDAAIEIFDRLAKLINKPEINTIAAIVRRKKKEQ